MSDWPGSFVNPLSPSVSSFGSRTQPGLTINNIFVSNASAVWGALLANTAVYVPFTVERGALAQKMGVQVGTQSGNIDVGIYNEAGTKLVSIGSTAVAAAGLQTFDIADTWLDPGTYYMAMAVDNTVAAFIRASLAVPLIRIAGVRQQTSAFALPSPATFAAASVAYLPWIAVQFGSVL